MQSEIISRSLGLSGDSKDLNEKKAVPSTMEELPKQP